MWKMAQFAGQLKNSKKVDKFESHDAVITWKWIYNHPRVYLCQKDNKNWPNVILGELKNPIVRHDD